MAAEDLRENPFRDEICAALVAKGYVEGQKGDYVMDRALDRARLLEFLERTQEPELAKFRAAHGADWQNRLLRL